MLIQRAAARRVARGWPAVTRSPTRALTALTVPAKVARAKEALTVCELLKQLLDQVESGRGPKC